MKRYLLAILLALVTVVAPAQEKRPFDTKVFNDEYRIYLRMNFYDKDLSVPGADVLGKVDGYIASLQSGSRWFIVGSTIKSKTEAEIEVVNDYGSEDFTATLKYNGDGTYTFRKRGGSTLKFAVAGKWQKLPGTFTLEQK